MYMRYTKQKINPVKKTMKLQLAEQPDTKTWSTRKNSISQIYAPKEVNSTADVKDTRMTAETEETIPHPPHKSDGETIMTSS